MKYREIFESVDSGVEELLKKFQRRTGAVMTKKGITAVLDAIGFKHEEQLKLFSLKGESLPNAERERLGFASGILHWPKDGQAMELYRYVSDNKAETIDQARELVDAAHELALKSKPGSKLKKGSFYYEDVSKVEVKKFTGGQDIGFTAKVSVAVPTLVITNTKGKSFDLRLDFHYVNVREFNEWAKTEGVDAAVNDIIGEKKETKQRTRENTGTCGVCGKEYKLAGEHLVMHGFQRPGHGYTVGKCFGVGYKPWEKSNQSVKDYIVNLKKILKDDQKALDDFYAGRVKTLMKPVAGNRSEKVTSEDPSWDKLYKAAQRNLEREIEYIESDIEMYGKRLEKWKEEDLPWDKISKK